MEGSIIIVTGAGSGIGKALATELRQCGATVVACSRRSSKDVTAVDVRDASAVRLFVQSVLRAHGRIDVLVNCAGWIGQAQSLPKVSLPDYARTIETNVGGVFHFMRAVLPAMEKKKRGVVLTVASRAAARPHQDVSVYSASKAAVVALTQAVARGYAEAKTNIRCITFSPGGVDTAMRRKLYGKKDSERQTKPEAIAAFITECISTIESLPNGADVRLSKDGKTEIFPMA